jgi:hypothetical protein
LELEKQQTHLLSNATWKRDHCKHYNGVICQEWQSSQKIEHWEMKQEADKWKLLLSTDPERCATCPVYKKKASQPTN